MTDSLLEISKDYGISFEELNERYGVRMDNMDEHRCTAINKNGKRCVKMRKDGCDICAIHFNAMKRMEKEDTSGSTSDKDTTPTGSLDKKEKRARIKRSPKEKMIETETLFKERTSSSTASSSSGIMILETEKKRGIYPEKIKKIVYSGRQYYINKTGWVYEMNQEDEMILSDIPIGKMMNERIVRLNYM